jgi:hypothetical protein
MRHDDSRVRMYSQCYFPAWLRRISDRVSLLHLFTMDNGTMCPKRSFAFPMKEQTTIEHEDAVPEMASYDA